jgi:hypothetical protein
MLMQRWRARWLEEGREREHLFDSVSNLAIARIDFLLICADPRNALRVPDHFTLEEVVPGEQLQRDHRASLFPPHVRGGERKGLGTRPSRSAIHHIE